MEIVLCGYWHRNNLLPKWELSLGKCQRCRVGTYPRIWGTLCKWKILFGRTSYLLFGAYKNYTWTISNYSTPSEVSCYFLYPLTVIFLWKFNLYTLFVLDYGNISGTTKTFVCVSMLIFDSISFVTWKIFEGYAY